MDIAEEIGAHTKALFFAAINHKIAVGLSLSIAMILFSYVRCMASFSISLAFWHYYWLLVTALIKMSKVSGSMLDRSFVRIKFIRENALSASA